jgi:hypothetical protein
MKTTKSKTTKAPKAQPKPEEQPQPQVEVPNELFVSLTAFFLDYETTKRKHDKGELTNEQFINDLLKNISDKGLDKKKKKATKMKAKGDPPKYKRITVEQFDEYQTLKAK